MLDFLFFLALLAMAFITICGIFDSKSKLSKWVCIITVIILVFSAFVTFPIYNKATNEAEISNVEITEIYKNSENEYCVKLNQSDVLFKVKVTEVYKGDSNYLIRYYHPNMSKVHEFLFEKEKTEYVLVVTDLNIPVLSTID